MEQRTEPGPLRRLFDSYAVCLAMDQSYLAENKGQKDLDLDRLESLLSIRAGLMAEAERSFKALEADWPAARDREPESLRRQVAEVLGEMSENKLSAFLDERLRETGETLRQLRRTKPVFQRYSHLGGDKAAPSRINRHE